MRKKKGGEGMVVEHPHVLLLIALAALPFLGFGPRAIFVFSSFLVLPKNRFSRVSFFFFKTISALVVLTLVLALSGISLKRTSVGKISEGAQIIFLRDASGSMFSPYEGVGVTETKKDKQLKIDVATKAIEKFVSARGGDEYALIDFGSSILSRSNFVSNKDAFIKILNAPVTDLSGTVIDQAIFRALGLLKKESSIDSRALILLTDGRGRLEGIEDMVYWMGELNVTLWWIFIGNEDDWKSSVGMFDLINRYSVVGRAGAFRADSVKDLDLVMEKIRSFERGIIRYPKDVSKYSLTDAFYKAALFLFSISSFFVLFGLLVKERKDER